MDEIADATIEPPRVTFQSRSTQARTRVHRFLILYSDKNSNIGFIPYFVDAIQIIAKIKRDLSHHPITNVPNFNQMLQG